MSSYRNYYDTTFGRRSDTASKSISDSRSTPSRIATKYGSGLGSTSRETASSRVKILLDKDTLHPPVSYKSTLSRSGTRSRDPSPSIEKSEKSTTSSSSTYLNPNRLYPRPYTRSTSRESTVSPTGSTSNLPRLSTTAAKRDDTSVTSKYGGRSSISKDESYKYGGRSSTSKDDGISSKYKSSREDLSLGSQKYLTSRFLPKNSVERSYTAYSRPSSIRTHEVSRKNKELLSVLHAQQEQEKLASRPASRCSSVAPEDIPKSLQKKSPEKERVVPQKVEIETVKVCTRGTSPTLGSSTQPSFLRSRRMELAKTIEKTITRPKTIRENMVDKEVQSDRLDDSTRSSRFAGASRISATPWTSFLDMKFSSPNGKKEKKTKQGSAESPKSLSRTSSTKSIGSVKSDKDKEAKKLPASTKSKLIQPKQLTDKKQLPPPIPKSESSSKPNSLHSLNPQNKDFRKSVLNMNPDGSKKKVGRRSNSASSADSDNCDPDSTDVTENLTGCKSYQKSDSNSKLPQKIGGDKQRGRRSPSSDVSIGSTSGPSSSEDDVKSKKDILISANSSRTSVVLTSADDFSTDKSCKAPQIPKTKVDGGKNEQEAKNFLMRALAPVTNLFKANRQSQGPVDNEHEANNLESTINEQEKVVWILDPSSDSVSDQNSYSQSQRYLEPKSAKLVLHRVESNKQNGPWQNSFDNSIEINRIQQRTDPADMKYVLSEQQPTLNKQLSPNSLRQHSSGEAPWWLDPQQMAPEGVQVYAGYNAENNRSPTIHQSTLRHIESGEKPWWLDENAQSPEGVQTYPNWVPQQAGNQTQEYHVEKDQQNYSQQPVIRHVQSGEIPWWLEENPSVIPEGTQVYPNSIHKQKQWNQQQNYPENPKFGHVESGEMPRRLKKDGTPPGGVHTWSPGNQDTNMNDQSQGYQKKPNIRSIDSGEAPWWLRKEGTPPEGVQTYPAWTEEQIDSSKFQNNDSENSTWWQDSEKANSDSNNVSTNEGTNFGQHEYLKKHKLRHIDSGERAWWLNDDEASIELVQPKDENESKTKYAIKHQDSGERARWLQDSQEFDSQGVPLGDRASPEGLEMPKNNEGRLSPYDNIPNQQANKKSMSSLFISRHTNIDDILGGTGQLWSPVRNQIFEYDEKQCREVDAREVIVHEGNGAGTIMNREEKRNHTLHNKLSV